MQRHLRQKADSGLVRKKIRVFYADGTTWAKPWKNMADQGTARRVGLGLGPSVEESGRAHLSKDLG